MKIGVSGGQGSFSEEAARLYAASARIETPKFVYLTFVEHVLSALEKGEIDRGIFAIENSNGGVVTEYLPAIGAHRFRIVKLFDLPVHHMLMAVRGTKASSIKTIVSQKQALRQCRMYLQRTWPETEVREYEDTAKAAEDLAKGILPKHSAVIASRAAAQVHKLEIIEESIQDLKFNVTTFIVAKRLKE
jgi:prephenate dehydratase